MILSASALLRFVLSKAISVWLRCLQPSCAIVMVMKLCLRASGGNILVRMAEGSGGELIPIDHGLCLPGSFSDISFEWRYWCAALVNNRLRIMYPSQVPPMFGMSFR